jgi:hypothetical protein
MFLLLPLLAGPLLGWKAPRTLAIGIQALFAIIAAVVLVATAPDHGGSYSDAVFVVPVVAVVSTASLWGGFVIARRRSAPGSTL